MEKKYIVQLHSDFEIAVQKEKNIEFWYARDLQRLLGYNDWKNFVKVIDKARDACLHSKNRVSDHFSDVGKMIDLGKGGQRQIDDIKLTRDNFILTGLQEEIFQKLMRKRERRSRSEIKSNNLLRKLRSPCRASFRSVVVENVEISLCLLRRSFRSSCESVSAFREAKLIAESW